MRKQRAQTSRPGQGQEGLAAAMKDDGAAVVEEIRTKRSSGRENQQLQLQQEKETITNFSVTTIESLHSSDDGAAVAAQDDLLEKEKQGEGSSNSTPIACPPLSGQQQLQQQQQNKEDAINFKVFREQRQVEQRLDEAAITSLLSFSNHPMKNDDGKDESGTKNNLSNPHRVTPSVPSNILGLYLSSDSAPTNINNNPTSRQQNLLLLPPSSSSSSIILSNLSPSELQQHNMQQKFRCVHMKAKSACLECFPDLTSSKIPCPHGKRKYYCTACGGGGMCDHGRRKGTCRTCNGTESQVRPYVRKKTLSYPGGENSGEGVGVIGKSPAPSPRSNLGLNATSNINSLAATSRGAAMAAESSSSAMPEHGGAEFQKSFNEALRERSKSPHPTFILNPVEISGCDLNLTDEQRKWSLREQTENSTTESPPFISPLLPAAAPEDACMSPLSIVSPPIPLVFSASTPKLISPLTSISIDSSMTSNLSSRNQTPPRFFPSDLMNNGLGGSTSGDVALLNRHSADIRESLAKYMELQDKLIVNGGFLLNSVGLSNPGQTPPHPPPSSASSSCGASASGGIGPSINYDTRNSFNPNHHQYYPQHNSSYMQSSFEQPQRSFSQMQEDQIRCEYLSKRILHRNQPQADYDMNRPSTMRHGHSCRCIDCNRLNESLHREVPGAGSGPPTMPFASSTISSSRQHSESRQMPPPNDFGFSFATGTLYYNQHRAHSQQQLHQQYQHHQQYPQQHHYDARSSPYQSRPPSPYHLHSHPHSPQQQPFINPYPSNPVPQSFNSQNQGGGGGPPPSIHPPPTSHSTSQQ